jgi:hypothetical protein
MLLPEVTSLCRVRINTTSSAQRNGNNACGDQARYFFPRQKKSCPMVSWARQTRNCQN